MVVVLLLVVLALVLVLIGMVGENLSYVVYIAGAVLFVALVQGAVLWRRTGRRPVR